MCVRFPIKTVELVQILPIEIFQLERSVFGIVSWFEDKLVRRSGYGCTDIRSNFGLSSCKACALSAAHFAQLRFTGLGQVYRALPGSPGSHRFDQGHRARAGSPGPPKFTGVAQVRTSVVARWCDWAVVMQRLKTTRQHQQPNQHQRHQRHQQHL